MQDDVHLAAFRVNVEDALKVSEKMRRHESCLSKWLYKSAACHLFHGKIDVKTEMVSCVILFKINDFRSII